jgi:hypothetical protein
VKTLILVLVAATSFAGQRPELLIRRDLSSQQTIITPRRIPTIGNRLQSWKCYPYILQGPGHSKTLSLRLESNTAIYAAAIAIDVNGTRSQLLDAPWQHDQMFDTVFASFAILDGQEKLIRAIASADDAWITVSNDKFEVSLHLTAEEIQAFRLVVEHYDLL